MTFALKVVGTSLTKRAILDGDYIFVAHATTASAGELVVVLEDDEIACREFAPGMHVVGRVTGIFRRLESGERCAG